jgi:hypothetical protein
MLGNAEVGTKLHVPLHYKASRSAGRTINLVTNLQCRPSCISEENGRGSPGLTGNAEVASQPLVFRINKLGRSEGGTVTPSLKAILQAHLAHQNLLKSCICWNMPRNAGVHSELPVLLKKFGTKARIRLISVVS